jgi:hypothetical protein
MRRFIILYKIFNPENPVENLGELGGAAGELQG